MDLNPGNQKRNIIFIVGTLESGGIERSVTEWCLHLKGNGLWTPKVICILGKRGMFLDVLQRESIEVSECLLENSRLIPFTIRIARQLRKSKGCIVHSQVAFSLVWQTWGYALGGASKIIFTQQNEYQNWNALLPKLRLRLYYFLSRPFISYYTCVSTQVRQNLAHLLGVPSRNFYVIYNSTNVEYFQQKPPLRENARAAMGLQNEFCIGMVASASFQKGHEYILQACAYLKKKGVNDFKLILIGNGDFRKLEELTTQLDIRSEVSFLGSRTDVPVLLQGMDCFVLSSRWEGLPLALIEAMATGLPAIATDVTGNNEVIENEVSGILVPKENAQALADAILRIRQDATFCSRIASQGMQRVRDVFSLDRIMEQYVALYSL